MLKFLGRLIYRLGILFLVSIPLQLIGIIILLPVCLYQGTSLKPLPKLLRWFDNADQFVGRNTDTYFDIYRSGWWNRYIWMAFRNPLNYFGYSILGYKVKDLVSDYGGNENYSVGDGVENIEGFLNTEVSFGLWDEEEIYEYYYIKAYNFFGLRKCFRFRMGYKIGDPYNIKIGDVIQSVMVIQPFMTYSGK